MIHPLAFVLLALVLVVGYMLLRGSRVMRVKSIYIYPLKSCKGVQLQSSEFDRLGFVHDRRFMVISATGRHVAQREYPAMALIEPIIDEQMDVMRIRFPDENEELIVPLVPRLASGLVEKSPVAVFDQQMDGLVFTEPHIGAWFNRVLKVPTDRPLRLASIVGIEQHERPFEAAFDRTQPDLRIQPAFGDQAPFLLTTSESLAAVNAWTVPTGRRVEEIAFRPNIVCENAPAAWSEDLWRRIRITPAQSDAQTEGVEFWLAKAAPRCILTTVVPSEGKFHRSGQPLQALREHRKLLEHVPSQAGGPLFGHFLMPTRPNGSIRVGDIVTVAEARTHLYDPARDKVPASDAEVVAAQDSEDAAAASSNKKGN